MVHHPHQRPGADPVAEHKAAGKARVRCLVVTISDTRTLATDKSGARAAELLVAAGHSVAGRQIIPDESGQIHALLQAGIDNPGTDALITTGGTGLAPRDVTTRVVDTLLTRRLDGFGELFRMLSFEEIGSAAMLSGATGGLAGSTMIFALPGSTKAVELGVSRLIIPELSHILGLIRE
ncbi:MAG: MogA/MoaB family molybdenum cofactor biosynthesis protein [bacterium]